MLNKGDTIGIIALAGDCELEKIEKAKSNLEGLGYKVILSDNICDKDKYLAGSDEDKIKNLHAFFSNPEVKLILNARGGYGAIKLINKIDYNIIKSNPKIFCGFSDITALLLMIYKKTGLITYHAPMACSDFAEVSDFTYENFLAALNNKKLEFVGNKLCFEGSAQGILWGGNLITVASLCGLDFFPEEDFILFIEDVNEPVYKIDRALTQLFNINEFRLKCKGIVLGEFMGCDNDIWLESMFSDLAKELNIPIVSGFKITHNKDKITLPIGSRAVLTGTKLEVVQIPN